MRFLKICRVFAKYNVFYKLTSHRNDILGKRLRLAFEELGLTFIKIGQILSMRYDLLPRKDCEELQQLLDNVNPLSLPVIYQIIEKEYGRPHSLVFKKFYELPLGSASVSQVHKAELFDGRLVAVKIKRPNVDYAFNKDIKIMMSVAKTVGAFVPVLRRVQVTKLVKYFESWIQQDLNFPLEAINMQKIADQYSFGQNKFRSDLGKGLFIRPHLELCTTNIIVMDFIDGIPMSRKEEILANPAYNIEKSIKTYVSAAMRNWFRDDISHYLFQADPHLSNILALPGGDAANIDCGLISELSKKEGEQCRNLIIAVYLQDLKKVLRIATAMCGVNYEKYAPIIQPDIEVYLSKTKSEGFGFWFLDFARIMVKNKIKFPLYLTTFGRTNVILDGLINTYFPEKTTLDIVGEELKRQAVWETWQNIKQADWLQLAYAVSEKIKQGPAIITEIINDPLGVISDIARVIKTAA